MAGLDGGQRHGLQTLMISVRLRTFGMSYETTLGRERSNLIIRRILLLHFIRNRTNLDMTIVNKLIDSKPKRLQAVIDVNGGYSACW